jgi:Toprim domain
MIGLDSIDRLTGGRLGTFDVLCPECGPSKRAAHNQRRQVLRVWRAESGFATFHCARCGESGFAFDRRSTPPDPAKLAKARAEAAERDRALRAERLSKARWLWSHRWPIAGSITETYLREARGYSGLLPATLGFLSARGEHPPAMIAAFGIARELEPGVIAIADGAVTGVHVTRLRPDGSGKATFEDPDEPAKIMIGYSAGAPIVLAPPNELLGLAIAEGIEDGLCVHQDTGLGVWAAGAASRMPALAIAVPEWINFTTVVADDDRDGKRHASALANELRARAGWGRMRSSCSLRGGRPHDGCPRF